MCLQRLARRTRSAENSIRAGLMVAAGAFGAQTLVATHAIAQPTLEASEAGRHVYLRASLLHAGSTGADVERVMGNPTVATNLGGPESADTALVYANEPIRTRITLTAGRVTAIATDIAYVNPMPLPARARVIKATMVRGGVTGLLGTPEVDRRWMETGRNIEQMIFARSDEPEFSVFLNDGLVVDVTLGRERPPGITSMLLPTAVQDSSVMSHLTIGATYHQCDGDGLVTVTFIGGVLTAFTIWPSTQ